MTKQCAHETGPWLAGQQWPRCLKCEIERLRAKLDSIRARCLNLAQWIDKGCDPKHGATEASFIALFAKEPSDEPGACGPSLMYGCSECGRSDKPCKHQLAMMEKQVGRP